MPDSARKRSVLLVEDEPSASERMRRALGAEPRLALAGVAASVADGRALLSELAPDLLVTDIGLPDGSGVELIRAVSEQGLATLCLVNTVFADDASVFEALEAGALGYLLKDEPPEELVRCTLELLAGGSPMSPAIARKVLGRFRAGPAPPAAAPAPPVAREDLPHLSVRELEVLNLIVKGFKYDEIAGLLGVSAATVATHVQRVYRKLAVNSRSEAAYEATQLGLINPKA
ncbi:MAG TPA: response regulator transcription factor [Myxococcota bacterium]